MQSSASTTPTREPPPGGARERQTPPRVIGLSPKREHEIQLLELVQRLTCDDTRRTASSEILSILTNLAADSNERAVVHELNMLLKMLTRQLVDQKGPAVVATLDLIAEAARLHKTEHIMPAVPHIVHWCALCGRALGRSATHLNFAPYPAHLCARRRLTTAARIRSSPTLPLRSLVKTLSTYDGRVHRACALVFGAFAACLNWSAGARADEAQPGHWAGVQLAPLLSPLCCVLTGQVKEQQTGASVCIVEVVAMAPTPLLNNALPALVAKVLALVRTRQTLVSAHLLGGLRAMCHVGGVLFEPMAAAVLQEAVAIAKERRLATETDDWHVKKAAVELIGALACRFPAVVPLAPPKEPTAEAGGGTPSSAQREAASPAQHGTPTQPHAGSHAPVTRESVYRLLGKLRTDPAKPVREAVCEALDAMKAHCALPAHSTPRNSLPGSAAGSRRNSSTPASLRKAKEAAAAAADMLKENAPDGQIIISPGNRPARSLFAAPVNETQPGAADAPSHGSKALGERNDMAGAEPADTQPRKTVTPAGNQLAIEEDEARVDFADDGAAAATDEAAAEALAAEALTTYYDADEASVPRAPANEGSPGAVVQRIVQRVFVPSRTLDRTPLAEHSQQQQQQHDGQARGVEDGEEDWKRMLSPAFEALPVATPRSLIRQLNSPASQQPQEPMLQQPSFGAADAGPAGAEESAAEASTAAASSKPTQAKPAKSRARNGLRLVLAAALISAAVFLAQTRVQQPTVPRVASGSSGGGARQCVERLELGGVAVQHCGIVEPPRMLAQAIALIALPASAPAVPEEVPAPAQALAAPQQPQPPPFGMPEGADADIEGGVAHCVMSGERTCNIVDWSAPVAAAVSGKAGDEGMPPLGFPRMSSFVFAALIAWLAHRATRQRKGGGAENLGSYVEYNERLRSPVRALDRAPPRASACAASCNPALTHWPPHPARSTSAGATLAPPVQREQDLDAVAVALDSRAHDCAQAAYERAADRAGPLSTAMLLYECMYY